MIYKTKGFFTLATIACFIIHACKNETEDHNEADKKYEFILQLSTGQKFYYTIHNTTITIRTINGIPYAHVTEAFAAGQAIGPIAIINARIFHED